jgi:hypothetical protein
MDHFIHNLPMYPTVAQIVPEIKNDMPITEPGNTTLRYIIIGGVALLVVVFLLWRRHHRRYRRYKLH